MNCFAGSEDPHYLFHQIGEMGFAEAKVGSLAGLGNLPFSVEVKLDGKLYNVVMEVLERLERQVSFGPSNGDLEASRSCEIGVHLMFEIQSISPELSDMTSTSTFLWQDQTGQQSVEWNTKHSI